jgi:RNA polymerase-binding transcription factor DksA
MSTNSIRLVEVPIEGNGSLVWHRLHSEREDICEALNKGPVNGDMPADDQSSTTWREGLLQARLRKIDGALDRLMSGTYGECSKCGKWIEDTKLDFDPAIEFCLGCWPGEVRKAENERLKSAEQNRGWATSTGPLEQAVERNTSDEITFAHQAPFASIRVHTLNTIYRIFLLDPETGRALVEGGQYLSEPEETILGGSVLSDGSFKQGWIGEGCRMQMWVKGRFLSTSPVQSVRVENAISNYSPTKLDPQRVM